MAVCTTFDVDARLDVFRFFWVAVHITPSHLGERPAHRVAKPNGHGCGSAGSVHPCRPTAAMFAAPCSMPWRLRLWLPIPATVEFFACLLLRVDHGTNIQPTPYRAVKAARGCGLEPAALLAFFFLFDQPERVVRARNTLSFWHPLAFRCISVAEQLTSLFKVLPDNLPRARVFRG
jgi:hypothetical protein